MQEFADKPSRSVYLETFEQGPGGWFIWNTGGLARLAICNGTAISCSPWWVDFNHAPPGAGYLHLLYYLNTGEFPDPTGYVRAATGNNRFVEGGYSRNFTNTEMTFRIRGELELRGAQVVLLVQTKLPHTTVNLVLTAQPIQITPQWSEQTLHLVPDPQQWRNMGSRHDRTDVYGSGDIAEALKDINLDIILVLFPLDIVPLGPISGDPHRLRAHVDYLVDPRRLPEGCVWLDRVEIRYPN